jgi:hypothetical protein
MTSAPAAKVQKASMLRHEYSSDSLSLADISSKHREGLRSMLTTRMCDLTPATLLFTQSKFCFAASIHASGLRCTALANPRKFLSKKTQKGSRAIPNPSAKIGFFTLNSPPFAFNPSTALHCACSSHCAISNPLCLCC